MAEMTAEERAARAILKYDPLEDTLLIQRAVAEEIRGAEHVAAAQARAEEREACAVLADSWAAQNKEESAKQRRRANKLGDDPFGHGDQAYAAADVLSETAREAEALAAAFRARSTD